MPKTKTKTPRDYTLLIAIIGLAGTLGAALLSSPVLIALIEKKGTPTPPPAQTTEAPPITDTASAGATKPGATATSKATNPTNMPQPTANPMVFEADFSDGSLSGFTAIDGLWEVVKDQNNQVLSVDGSSGKLFGYALYGPKDFSNGTIEFRLKFNTIGAGAFYALVRQQDSNNAYTFTIQPGPKKVVLGKFLAGNQIEVVPFASNTEDSYTFNKNQWYIIKIELDNNRMQVYVNGSPLLTGYDALFQNGELAFLVGKKTAMMLDDVKVTKTK